MNPRHSIGSYSGPCMTICKLGVFGLSGQDPGSPVLHSSATCRNSSFQELTSS